MVREVGVGTMFFKREIKLPLKVMVLYFPWLKNNLISMSMIEEKGYEVVFRDGKVLMYPRESISFMLK